MEYQNKKMGNLRKKISTMKELKTGSSISKFLWIIWPEFIEFQECIVRRNLKKDYAKIDINNILLHERTRTSYESSVNEFRIEDYLDGYLNDSNGNYNPIEGLALGLKTIEIWEYKLKKNSQVINSIYYLDLTENIVQLDFIDIEKMKEA